MVDFHLMGRSSEWSSSMGRSLTIAGASETAVKMVLQDIPYDDIRCFSKGPRTPLVRRHEWRIPLGAAMQLHPLKSEASAISTTMKSSGALLGAKSVHGKARESHRRLCHV